MNSEDQTLQLIGRSSVLFKDDMVSEAGVLSSLIKGNRFLVIGGAGTIGQSVTKEIFKRDPKVLHVVDINENNMVELVRDIRSTMGYISGEFKTFAVDCGSEEFEALFRLQGPYDYIFNLSALKHVRSEKDPFTLMRMITVNVFNTIKTLRLAKKYGTKKYFCVSTDKAANPVNLMGASKRIMEMFLMRESESLPISMARFANVAFSDGSLLHGFKNRVDKMQPISAPYDVRRYFLTKQEAGELCLISGLLGENRDIFFPKLEEDLHLITFSEIAERFVRQKGYEPFKCSSENEARERCAEVIENSHWPCYFFNSDTTGEKAFEEFFTSTEDVDLSSYRGIGVVKNLPHFDEDKLNNFSNGYEELKAKRNWHKSEIVDLFLGILPDLAHKETGKYLDQRM